MRQFTEMLFHQTKADEQFPRNEGERIPTIKDPRHLLQPKGQNFKTGVAKIHRSSNMQGWLDSHIKISFHCAQIQIQFVLVVICGPHALATTEGQRSKHKARADQLGVAQDEDLLERATELGLWDQIAAAPE